MVSKGSISSNNKTINDQENSPIIIFYGKNSIKARIQKEVALFEVLRQLTTAKQLQIDNSTSSSNSNSNAKDFVLRTKDGELITESNMYLLLEGGKTFTLGSSPAKEAKEIMKSLRADDVDTVKLATFSLKLLLKDREFLNHFIKLGGFFVLQEIILISDSNTLAYSLLALQTLLILQLEIETEAAGGLDNTFYSRLVEIIATEPLISIIRPATAILRNLVAPLSSNASSSSSRTSRFAMVYEQIIREEKFLPRLISRISSDELEASELSFDLLNVLYRGSIQLNDTRLADEVERLNVWTIVGNMLTTKRDEDLSDILSFQANLISSLHLSLTTRTFKAYYYLFDQIWDASSLPRSSDKNYRWQQLGFKSESPQLEFETTGLLGVKALARFAINHTSDFKAIIKEQQQKSPPSHRCPFATISSRVTLILAQHFDITIGISHSPHTPQPFLYFFYDYHHLITLFFIKMWNQSSILGTTTTIKNDLDRITSLVKSQVEFVLGGNSLGKNLNSIRLEFSNAEYTVVRDREIDEIEKNDQSFDKASIRALRARIYAESYQFVRQQRIKCLYDGAWFLLPKSSPGHSSKKSQPKYRFVRLCRNTLYFLDALEPIQVQPGVEDLPLKLDLALVSEISAAGSNRTSRALSLSKATSMTSSSTPASPSTLTFSLSANDGTIVELTAIDKTTFSSFIDGLRFLRSDSSTFTEETMGYIESLTDIAVKVKLLDCTGEKFEIAKEVKISPVPQNCDFFYSTM